MTCIHPHAVVTGTSSGIGRATALRLADAGWHVFAGVRHTDDGESLRRASHSGPAITPVLMDVTNTDQISAGVEAVTEHVGPAGLNALVDNAGIGVAAPMELVSLESLRWQFEVNVFGQVAVSQAFLPLLRQANGRLVIIGSIGDRFTPPFGGPLAASKAAIASIADAIRQELAPWGIRVVLLEPGSIRTDAVDKLQRDAVSAANGFSVDGRELYRESYLGMVSTAMKREQNGSPPEVVADKVLMVLKKSRPRARYVVGKDAHMLANLARFVPTLALDALRRKIFNLPDARLTCLGARAVRSYPMKLANVEQVQALDPVFGRMAAEVGMHAWSLPQLTMREKAFVFLAADLCTANVGFPLLTHVQMAGANGVSVPECIAAIRHLAPYVGYPTVARRLATAASAGIVGRAGVAAR